MDERKLIETVWAQLGPKPHARLRLGIGDDASVHAVRAGYEWVVSTDASIAGVHWPSDFPLEDAARKAVAAALSDLAAMGAEPEAVWAAVGAPDTDAVLALAAGVGRALDAHEVPLAGGDLTRAPVAMLALTCAGWVPEGTAMRRDRAQVGETVWLAGPVGLAHLALKQWQAGRRQGGMIKFFVPQARLHTGMRLRELGVRCCIDVSDGLLLDAERVALASGVGMEIDLDATPAWSALVEKVGLEAAIEAVASGGEDYALLFTAPKDKGFLEEIAAPIGRVVEGGGVRAFVAGREVQPRRRGFVHF
ncbi:MAG: thiamine-phosphate kinase [Zetaproteobacteria bacterium]|nr:MAG: thiamine-phosphate kinase [Zetaproteobacteria bacterium]